MQAALKARQKAAKEQFLDESNRWDCHLHRLLLQHSKAFTHSTLHLCAGQQAERHTRQQSVILCQMRMRLKWWTMARGPRRSP